MRKAMKKIAAVMIALVAVIAIAGTSIPAEAAAKKPTKITLTATTKTIDVKGKTTVSVKSVKPANASKSVSFKSSNKKVATVSSKGVVTGKKAGKVTITVTSKTNKKVKSTIKITVKNLKPSKISVGGLSMNAGERKTLKVTVKPTGVYCPVSYKSSNSKVATVNSKGEVKALKTGTAKITVTAKEKNSKGKKISATCTVKVTTKVSKLTFADKAKTLKTIGDTYTNKLTVSPANADNKKVTYKSSNTDVATVDASGKVTTKAYGETTITATAADGSKKTASYKLTVADRANDDIAWQYMTCDEVFESIDKDENLIIIDLRKDSMPQKEGSAIADAGYAEGGHIEGSLQIPVWPTDTKELEDMLRSTYVMEQIKDNDSSLVFICQSGASGATRAISVLKDEGIDPSRMYILKGGGKELVKNYGDKLVKGSEAFTGEFVISASDLKAKIDAKEEMTLVDTRGVDSKTETAKNAITMIWQEISKTPVTDGTTPGQAGFARPLGDKEISEQLGKIGLGVNDQIILFSDGHVSGGWGDDGRIAWQLIQAGYKNVKIVNGGLTAMKAAGIETQTGPSARKAKEVSVTVDTETHDFTTEALLDRVKAGTVKVVDVRANAEYDGAQLYGEKSGGHIKGAIHIRFTDLFKYDGSLKSVAELTKMFEDSGLEKGDTIATYCTGGIRSAYMQLVLQMCGFADSHNYAESAYRWSNIEDAGTKDYWDLATAVKSLSFSKEEITLNAKGQTGKVKLTVKPANATNKEVEYSSDNTGVATVAADGTVTATGYGTATITAKAVNYPDVTATYTVNVVKADEVTNAKQVYVSPEWVKNAIDGDVAEYENAFVSEVSWGELSGAKNYKKAHVPGAYHINSDAVEYDDCDPWPMGDGYDDFALYGELEIKPEDNFNIRSAEQLAEFLKRNNITKDTKVILYGRSASDSSVTRVAFAMLYAGVEDVKVIDGGMQGWNNANLPTETTVNEQVAGGDDYAFGTAIPAHSEYIMSIEDVKDNLENDPNFRLVSIRSEEEFVGKTSGYGYIADDHAGEPLGAVWGHNTDDGSYVTEDGKVASIENLKAVLAESGSSLENEISFYCGTGWRATIPFLIAYQAGVEDISLYDGGWWLWQLKHYGWEDKGIEAQPDVYPIQQVTPEEALNYVQLSFAEEAITTDASGKALAVGATAKANELTVRKAARVDATVAYTSSDENVAVVAEDGTVTAKGIGTATITAKAGSYEASYTVTVGEAEETTNYISADDLYADLAGNKTYKILDVRCYDNNERGNYVAGHIVGAVSADVDGAVSGNDNAAAEANVKAAIAGDSDSTKYVLVCYSGKSYAAAATKILKAEGIKNSNIFTLKDGMIGENGWTKTEKYNNYIVKTYTSKGGFTFQNGVTVDQLKADVKAEKSIYTVFDLRTIEEYDAGHINGAISTPLSKKADSGNVALENDLKPEGLANLQKGIDTNPKGFFVLECYSGNKYANMAVGYLRELGVSEEQMIVLEGGRAAWIAAEYPEVSSAE